jgi:hypothetical protein
MVAAQNVALNRRQQAIFKKSRKIFSEFRESLKLAQNSSTVANCY